MSQGSSRVFVMGDSCQANALAGDIDLFDERLTADNPNYYQLNAAWDYVPRRLAISARVDLLDEIVEKMSTDAGEKGPAYQVLKIAETRKQPVQGEFTRWRLSPDERMAWCDGVIGRYRTSDSKRSEIDIDFMLGQKVGSTDVLAMYCVSTGAGDYGLADARSFFEKPGVIVLRTNTRLFSDGDSFPGKLLSGGYEDIARKTIAIVTVDSIRRSSHNVRKGLSWEQLIQETLEEMKSISRLRQFGCIMVTFKSEGCLMWFPQEGSCQIVCYPSELEGAYSSKYNTTPFAAMATLQAAVVDGMARSGLNEFLYSDEATVSTLCESAEKGIKLTRGLFACGFDAGKKAITYPHSRLCEWLATAESPQMNSILITPDIIPEGFSILKAQVSRDGMIRVAREYVRGGRSAIEAKVDTVPYFEAGALLTFERDEIEQFNNLHNLLRGYASNMAAAKPLSICVFGSPGAGKSFAVKQVAKEVDKDNFNTWFEVNLSQMSSYNDLVEAFHRVANARLQGGIPIVFFDEFDSPTEREGELGWLKRFLAPMQDGVYTDGRDRFVIGKAVFVFAGGTCQDHRKFVDTALSAQKAKGKDFLSRINGYVDIIGINSDGGSSELPYLKRAVLLRSLILRKTGMSSDSHIDIDDKVLDAFLLVPEYYHDARSMEAIVATSSVAKGTRFLPSCIENNCLDLHVPREFNERLRASFATRG